MKILLLGEYSNLHWTIAEGLRQLGHNVVVASGGDRFKNYKRNVNLHRNGYGLIAKLSFGCKLLKEIRSFKGYDVVQIINPMFLDVKARTNLEIYNYLKKHNKKVFLGAFGVDYFWIKSCLDKKTFRYSEFFIGDQPTNIPAVDDLKKEWIGTEKEKVNKLMADSCDGIIACLYEYYVSYNKVYTEKLAYISEAINLNETSFLQRGNTDKVRFFIGIQKERSQIKGTDILYKVLQEINRKYPQLTEIKKVESVPYNEYLNTMRNSDVLLDQLYSYTPAMNAFIAMAQGLVIVGGGEPEAYEILDEYENRPIINVIPDEQDIFNKLENLVLNRGEIPALSQKSREFVEKHHDHIKIAQQYVDFWSSKF